MLKSEVIEKNIPRTGGTYDVIVVGSGSAGLGAALAAAHNGAKTLLLEGRSFFGGIGAVALWMPFNRLFLDGGSRGGVHEIFANKIRSYGRDAYVEGRHWNADADGLDIHPEYTRLAIFELLEEAGCHYRLYSPVTDVVMEGNKITGVVVSAKEGRQVFNAKVFVDATGDGDVAYYAGAEYMKGREEDGLHMSVTLTFALANTDEDRIINYWMDNMDELKEIVRQAAKEGYVTAKWYAFDRTTIPGVVSVNNGGPADVGNIDATVTQELTLVERFGIKVAVDFVRLARDKKIPGLENCYLMRVGSNVAVRDTRRIVGDYILTEEDARKGTKFDDVVSRKYGKIDAPGAEIKNDTMVSGFGYPYRSLIVKGIENLYVAGRCGSATFYGHAAGKSMGNMMGLGQAAGAAAALCSKKNIAPRQLDVKELQSLLISMGVKLFD
jgi:hypothetical protein